MKNETATRAMAKIYNKQQKKSNCNMNETDWRKRTTKNKKSNRNMRYGGEKTEGGAYTPGFMQREKD